VMPESLGEFRARLAAETAAMNARTEENRKLIALYQTRLRDGGWTHLDEFICKSYHQDDKFRLHFQIEEKSHTDYVCRSCGRMWYEKK